MARLKHNKLPTIVKVNRMRIREEINRDDLRDDLENPEGAEAKLGVEIRPTSEETMEFINFRMREREKEKEELFTLARSLVRIS